MFQERCVGYVVSVFLELL